MLVITSIPMVDWAYQSVTDQIPAVKIKEQISFVKISFIFCMFLHFFFLHKSEKFVAVLYEWG